MTEMLWKVHDSLEEIEQLESLRVFISGTYDDLREYRQIIADTLLQLRHEPCEPFKQTSSHDTLCAFARYQILEYTHAYLGFFGLRYGTRIDTQEDAVSISEYEYDLACEHLGRLEPAPLFVLLPEPGSELYEELKARAANQLKSNDADYIARDARSQEQFIDKIRRKKELGEGNRIVQPLHRESDIAARTVTCITSYTGRALRSRAGGAKSAVRQALRTPVAGPVVSPPPLPARLKPHLSQASALFYEFFNASKARLLPGLCVLIHGAPGRGQKILAEKIVESAIPWEVEAPCFHELSASSPDVERDVWEVLWNAAGVQPEQRARTDIEELASTS